MTITVRTTDYSSCASQFRGVYIGGESKAEVDAALAKYLEMNTCKTESINVVVLAYKHLDAADKYAVGFRHRLPYELRL